MNEKIPVGQIARLLSQQAGVSLASAELFIKAFFDVAAQTLMSGERLKIKGLGEFEVDASNADNPVTFTPDADLAAWLNAPFAEFEPEVISDDITEEALEGVGTHVDVAAPDTVVAVEETPVDAAESTEEVVEVAATPETIEPADEETVAETTVGAAEVTEVIVETPTAPAEEKPVETEAVETVAETPVAPDEVKPAETEAVETIAKTPAAPAEVKPAETEAVEAVAKTPEAPAEVKPAEVEKDETIAETPQAPAEVKPAEAEKVEAVAETPEAPAEVKPAEAEKVEMPTPPAPPTFTPAAPINLEKANDDEAADTSAAVAAVAAVEETSATTDDSLEEDEELMVGPTENRRSDGPGFGLGVFIGLLVGLALGACITYFAMGIIENKEVTYAPVVEENIGIEDLYNVSTPDTVTEEQPAESADSTETAPAAQEESTPQPEAQAAPAAAATDEKAVIEVVQPNYNLAKMAKKHYGEKSFWVYIFEENRDKLKSPDDLKQGMKLVIPPASKYGIDAKNPASVNAAKEKEKQLFAQQKR